MEDERVMEMMKEKETRHTVINKHHVTRLHFNLVTCSLFFSRVHPRSSTVSLTSTTTAMPTQDHANTSNSSPCPDSVPPGFTLLRGPDDRHYLVPDFYAGETMFAWDREETMALLDVDSASRKVSFLSVRQLDFTRLIFMDH